MYQRHLSKMKLIPMTLNFLKSKLQTPKLSKITFIFLTIAWLLTTSVTQASALTLSFVEILEKPGYKVARCLVIVSPNAKQQRYFCMYGQKKNGKLSLIYRDNTLDGKILGNTFIIYKANEIANKIQNWLSCQEEKREGKLCIQVKNQLADVIKTMMTSDQVMIESTESIDKLTKELELKQLPSQWLPPDASSMLAGNNRFFLFAKAVHIALRYFQANQPIAPPLLPPPLPTQKSAAKAEIAILNTHLSQVQRQLAMAQQKIQDTNNQLKVQTTQLEIAQQQLAKAHQEMNGKQSQIKAMNAQLEKGQNQLTNAHQEINDKQKQIKVLHTQLEKEQENLARLNTHLSQVQHQLATAQLQIDKQNNQLKVQATQLETAQQQLAKAHHSMTGKQNQITAMNAQLEKRQYQLTDAHQEINDKQKQIGVLHAKLEKEQENLALLTQTLNTNLARQQQNFAQFLKAPEKTTADTQLKQLVTEQMDELKNQVESLQNQQQQAIQQAMGEIQLEIRKLPDETQKVVQPLLVTTEPPKSEISWFTFSHLPETFVTYFSLVIAIILLLGFIIIILLWKIAKKRQTAQEKPITDFRKTFDNILEVVVIIIDKEIRSYTIKPDEVPNLDIQSLLTAREEPWQKQTLEKIVQSLGEENDTPEMFFDKSPREGFSEISRVEMDALTEKLAQQEGEQQTLIALLGIKLATASQLSTQFAPLIVKITGETLTRDNNLYQVLVNIQTVLMKIVPASKPEPLLTSAEKLSGKITFLLRQFNRLLPKSSQLTINVSYEEGKFLVQKITQIKQVNLVGAHFLASVSSNRKIIDFLINPETKSAFIQNYFRDLLENQEKLTKINQTWQELTGEKQLTVNRWQTFLQIVHKTLLACSINNQEISIDNQLDKLIQRYQANQQALFQIQQAWQTFSNEETQSVKPITEFFPEVQKAFQTFSLTNQNVSVTDKIEKLISIYLAQQQELSKIYQTWQHFSGEKMFSVTRLNQFLTVVREAFDIFPFPKPGDTVDKRVKDLTKIYWTNKCELANLQQTWQQFSGEETLPVKRLDALLNALQQAFTAFELPKDDSIEHKLNRIVMTYTKQKRQLAEQQKRKIPQETESREHIYEHLLFEYLYLPTPEQKDIQPLKTWQAQIIQSKGVRTWLKWTLLGQIIACQEAVTNIKNQNDTELAQCLEALYIEPIITNYLENLRQRNFDSDNKLYYSLASHWLHKIFRATALLQTYYSNNDNLKTLKVHLQILAQTLRAVFVGLTEFNIQLIEPTLLQTAPFGCQTKSQPDPLLQKLGMVREHINTRSQQDNDFIIDIETYGIHDKNAQYEMTVIIYEPNWWT